MKLHLPTSLRAALVACMACAAVSYADIYLPKDVNPDDLEGSARFYDGGKGRDWDDFERAAYKIYTANGNDLKIFGDLASSIVVPEYQSRLDCSKLYSDSGHCWAYTSSNMLQYWQTYYGVFSKKAGDTTKSAPVHGHNYNRTHLDELGGTQSLKLNKLFYDNFKGTAGGNTKISFGWYLYGENGWNAQINQTSAPGYFRQYFNNYDATHNTVNAQNLSSLEAMSNSIKQAFGYTQQNGEWVQTTKGQIMHLELKSGSSSHAITCYGFETDENGNVKALYVVNSDDGKHALVKVYTKFLDLSSDATGHDYRLELHYDKACSGYETYNAWTVSGWSSINTPDVLKNMLAEYESGTQTWMGNLESWTNSPTVAADVKALPTDETGWMTYAGTGTDHAGYYNTYYTAGSGVQFNDAATSGHVNVAEDITVSSMTVDNTNLAYTFDGGDTTRTITVDEFTKKGTGAVVFENVDLTAGAAKLEGDVTFNNLHVTGTLDATDKTIHANSVTLDGNATIGNLGAEKGEDGYGTMALTINGGKTYVKSEGRWTNLGSLTMADNTQLEVGASLSVAGNITQAEGAESGSINTEYCLKVGTLENGSVKQGTGDVTFAGNITAGAYIKILGNATVTGNVSTTRSDDKHVIEIGGNANIGGNLSCNKKVTIGGNGSIGGTATVSGDFAVGGDLSLQGGGSVGGKLSATNIELAAGKQLTTKGGVTVTNELTLGAGSTLSLGANAPSVSTNDSKAEGVISHASLTAEGVSGKSSTEQAVLSNIRMEVAEGATLTLENVVLDANTVLTGTNSVLQVSGVTLLLGDVNTMLASPLTQQLLTVADDELTQISAGPQLVLSVNSLQGLTLEGESITLDFSGLNEETRAALDNAGSYAIAFEDSVDFEGVKNLSMTLDGTTTTTITPDAGGNIFTFTSTPVQPGQAIPEPATATLSLLALAGLMARRRRK